MPITCVKMEMFSPDADDVIQSQTKKEEQTLAVLKIRKLFNQLVFATEKSLQYLYFEGRELSDEESKLWHYSPMTLYTMYQDELLTGAYDYPEEA